MARFAIALVALMQASADPNCAAYTFCEDCSTQISWSGTHCRWCPEDHKCHAFASLYNPCKSSENIFDPSQCPAPTPSPPSPPPTPDTRHWCGGSGVGSLSDSNVSVIYAQAPLFSTNPSIGGALGQIGLHHTAIVFQQDSTYWTLEFDLTAQNKDGHSISSGFLPDVDGLELLWDNQARWCLTDGLLHGQEHWVTRFESFAQILPTKFEQLMTEFVPSLNGTTAESVAVGYNLFRIVDIGGNELVPDVTCANGAIWLRDYLESEGMAIDPNFGFAVTRLDIQVGSISEVTSADLEQWQELVDFYMQFRGLFENSTMSIYGKISAVTAAFPLQFVYDSNKNKYFKLNNCATIPSPRFENAPSVWPLPFPFGPKTTTVVPVTTTTTVVPVATNTTTVVPVTTTTTIVVPVTTTTTTVVPVTTTTTVVAVTTTTTTVVPVTTTTNTDFCHDNKPDECIGISQWFCRNSAYGPDCIKTCGCCEDPTQCSSMATVMA